MTVHPKLTLILTLGALAISAPALAEPGGRDGFGPSGPQKNDWNNGNDNDNDFSFAKTSRGVGLGPQSEVARDFNGRGQGGVGWFDHDGRGPGPGFKPAFNRGGYLAHEARMKIQLGQTLVDQGKSLVRYGHRTHQWTFVKQGRELQHRGERLIRVGWSLAREARMLAFR